jgi:hypothetical protein
VRRRSFQKVGMQFSSTFVNILAQVMNVPAGFCHGYRSDCTPGYD